MLNFQIIPPFKAAEMVATLSGDVLGVEVTIPAIEAVCNLGNIDHHRKGDTSATPSACEQALTWEAIPDNTTIVGVLADADTLTAMAVIDAQYWEKEGYNPITPEGVEVVKAIGLIDRFGPAECADEMTLPEVKAIRAICARRDLNLSDQISLITAIITSDNPLPNQVVRYVKEAEKAAEKVAENAKITVLDNGIVVVESSDFAALQLGYNYGDVIVAVNPTMLKDFKDQSKGSYLKYTVCKRSDHHPALIDWDTLNILEGKPDNKWGGRSTIGGSPQGISSDLTIGQVVSCIKM